jgi:hypothetical protein
VKLLETPRKFIERQTRKLPRHMIHFCKLQLGTLHSCSIIFFRSLNPDKDCSIEHATTVLTEPFNSTYVGVHEALCCPNVSFGSQVRLLANQLRCQVGKILFVVEPSASFLAIFVVSTFTFLISFQVGKCSACVSTVYVAHRDPT